MNSVGALLITSINIFYVVLYVALIVRILLSWISVGTRSNPVLSIVYSITDPIILPIRKMLQQSPLGGRGMFIDFSPIFAIFIMQLVKNILVALIGFISF